MPQKGNEVIHTPRRPQQSRAQEYCGRRSEAHGKDRGQIIAMLSSQAESGLLEARPNGRPGWTGPALEASDAKPYGGNGIGRLPMLVTRKRPKERLGMRQKAWNRAVSFVIDRLCLAMTPSATA